MYDFRYISFGLFVMGCGSLIFSLPHFITGPYLSDSVIFEAGASSGAKDAGTQICNLNGDGVPDDGCVDKDAISSSLSSYRLAAMLSSYIFTRH